jgi:hypothetical protein
MAASRNFAERNGRAMQQGGRNETETMEHVKAEHRALALLRFLNRESGTMSNERIVAVRFEQIGLACCLEAVRACLEQVEKQALVKLSKVQDLIVVTLLAKGEEASRGLLEIEGVLKPWPECSY